MKTKTILALVSIILLFVSFSLMRELVQSKRNYNRLSESFAASSDELVRFKTRNGNQAVKIQVLQLRNAELKRIYPQILEEIKNLNINPKRINHYSETVIHQNKELITTLRDSILFDTIARRDFFYKDSFYQVQGNIIKDSIRMNIESTDSLIQVVYRGKRKRPWLWFLSSRKLEQAIYSKNPNSHIVYSKTISIIDK